MKKHKFMMRYIQLLTLFVLIVIVMGAESVHAQGKLAIQLQPTTIDEKVDPGQSVVGELTITNEAGGTETYYISTRNVLGMEDSGSPIFESEFANDPLEAAAWITPEIDFVELEVGESAVIPYRIDVPPDASPGSYFAAFFVSKEAEETTESGAGVGFHVVSLVNLRVNGEVIEDMLFREFFTDKVIYTKPSIKFTSRVDNDGTIHQRPKGVVVVNDTFGNKVATLYINENGGAILPTHDRVFETYWVHEGFSLGLYTAHASIGYGESDRRTMTRDVSFWIVPLKEISIVLGILIAMLLGAFFGVRMYIKRVLSRAGHDMTALKKDSPQLTLARKMRRTILWLIGIILLVFIAVIVFFS
jgi:hypothetical protein